MNFKFCDLVLQRSFHLSRILKNRLKYSQRLTSIVQQNVKFSSESNKVDSEGSSQQSKTGQEGTQSVSENNKIDSEGGCEPTKIVQENAQSFSERNKVDAEESSHATKTVEHNAQSLGDKQDSEERLINLLRKSSPLKFSEDAEQFWKTSPYPKGTVFEDFVSEEDDEESQTPLPEETSIILFPGQGNQFVGMAKNLVKYPVIQDMFDAANEILKYNLLKLCLEGPEEKLNETKYCQVATLVCSLAALEKLKEEKPQAINSCVATAGFSLGEYSALVFAGCLNFERAVKLVKYRAEMMDICCKTTPGGMMTVLYGPQSDLGQALKDANQHTKSKGIEVANCSVASYLFCGCRVIAGHVEALNFIIENYSKYKIRRISKLPVSGAFHTDIMKDAAVEFKTKLKNLQLNEPLIKVYSNVTGEPYRNSQDIIKILPKQIYKPVKWEQTMTSMYDRPKGTTFPFTYECGPGNSLSVILRKVNQKAGQTCYAVKL